MTMRHLAITTLLFLGVLASSASAQVGFVQPLLSGSDKTKGATLTLTGAATTQAGHDIFVAFAADPGGGPWVVGDNLGNNYLAEEVTLNPRMVEAVLFRAAAIVGGTITTITIQGAAPVVAKAAVAGEFVGVGIGRPAGGDMTFNWVAQYMNAINADTFPAQALSVGAAGYEQRGDDVIEAEIPSGTTRCDGAPIFNHLVGQAGTRGQGDRTNILAGLVYAIGATCDVRNYQGYMLLRSRDQRGGSAGAGGLYLPQ